MPIWLIFLCALGALGFLTGVWLAIRAHWRMSGRGGQQSHHRDIEEGQKPAERSS